MDYYQLLNISKNASEEEIRKAYKKLAFKYHPDKNRDNPDVENKFKDINKAYQVLSDKRKKYIYDQTGNEDMEVFPDMNIFNNLFSSFSNPNFMESILDDINVSFTFFPFNSENSFMQNKNPDKKIYNINTNLEYIFQKKIKKIEIQRTNQQGQEVSFNIKLPLHFREIIYHPENEFIDEVIINIFNKPHPLFKRINDFDLMIIHEIELLDIYHGFSFEFIHLDGRLLKVKSRAESLMEQQHFYQKIKDEGLPTEDTNKRGDLFIRYMIKFPTLENIMNDGKEKEEKEEVGEGNEHVVANNCPYEEVYKDDIN